MLSARCASQFVEDFARMRAPWGVQIAEMIFQTCSRKV